MKYEFVEVITKNNIKLPGMVTDNGNKKCIIYVPGMTGNFFESEFIRNLAAKTSEKGYDFIFSHNQGSFQIMDYKYLREDGKWKSKTIGTAFEDFEECLNDIQAWIDYAISIGKEEIILIGHSKGCNKIVYYLSKNDNSKISKVILLSPQDVANFNDLEFHAGMHEEAIKNIEEGYPDKLLTKKFLGFAYLSSKEYLEVVDSNIVNNLPYKLLRDDFSQFEKNNKETLVVIGTKDGGENSDKYMKEICKHAPNCSYRLIEDGNHTYDNKFDELNEVILQFI